MSPEALEIVKKFEFKKYEQLMAAHLSNLAENMAKKDWTPPLTAMVVEVNIDQPSFDIRWTDDGQLCSSEFKFEDLSDTDGEFLELIFDGHREHLDSDELEENEELYMEVSGAYFDEVTRRVAAAIQKTRPLFDSINTSEHFLIFVWPWDCEFEDDREKMQAVVQLTVDDPQLVNSILDENNCG